jgi:hypothetical protein
MTFHFFLLLVFLLMGSCGSLPAPQPQAEGDRKIPEISIPEPKTYLGDRRIALTEDPNRRVLDMISYGEGKIAYLYRDTTFGEPDAFFVHKDNEDFGPYFGLTFWHPMAEGMGMMLTFTQEEKEYAQIGEDIYGPFDSVYRPQVFSDYTNMVFETYDDPTDDWPYLNFHVFDGETLQGPFVEVSLLTVTPKENRVIYQYTILDENQRGQTYFQIVGEEPQRGGASYLRFDESGENMYLLKDRRLTINGERTNKRGSLTNRTLAGKPLFLWQEEYYIDGQGHGFINPLPAPESSDDFMLAQNALYDNGEITVFGFPAFTPYEEFESGSLYGVDIQRFYQMDNNMEDGLIYYNGELHGPFSNGYFLFAPDREHFAYVQKGNNLIRQVQYRDFQWGNFQALQSGVISQDSSSLAFVGQTVLGAKVLHNDAAYGPYYRADQIKISDTGGSIAYLVEDQEGDIFLFKDGREIKKLYDGAAVGRNHRSSDRDRRTISHYTVFYFMGGGEELFHFAPQVEQYRPYNQFNQQRAEPPKQEYFVDGEVLEDLTGQDLALLMDDPDQGFLHWSQDNSTEEYALYRGEEILGRGIMRLNINLNEGLVIRYMDGMDRRQRRRIGESMDALESGKGYFFSIWDGREVMMIGHKQAGQLTLYQSNGEVHSFDQAPDVWELRLGGFDPRSMDFVVNYESEEGDYVVYRGKRSGPLGDISRMIFDWDSPGLLLGRTNHYGQRRDLVAWDEGSYLKLEHAGRVWILRDNQLIQWREADQ